MRKFILLAALAALVLSGCVGGPPTKGTPSAGLLGTEQILPFVHVDGFGTPTDTAAWIAWEFEAQVYVRYQVAFTSCTCRQESVNERSLLYVEIAKSGAGGKIRKVWYNYWGDSPKFPSGKTRQDVEQDFMPLLVNQKLDTLDSVDTISGATVSIVNLKQILKALLAYHNAKYPAVGVPEPEDYVDAGTGATQKY